MFTLAHARLEQRSYNGRDRAEEVICENDRRCNSYSPLCVIRKVERVNTPVDDCPHQDGKNKTRKAFDNEVIPGAGGLCCPGLQAVDDGFLEGEHDNDTA